MKGTKSLAILLAFIFIINISACGNKTKTVPKVNTSESELFGEITVWSDKNNFKVMQKAGEQFHKLNPKVQINCVEIDEKNIYENITKSFASGWEVPDVFSTKNSNISMLVSKFPDGFLDVTADVNSIKGNIFYNQLSECSAAGDIFAFPWQVAPVELFYRKDIFNGVNIDPEYIRTWQDYIQAGKAILNSTNGNVKLLPVDENSSDLLYREMLNQLRTGYFSADGKPSLNSEKAFTAMSTIKKMNDSGIVLNFNGLDSLIEAIKSGSIASLPYGSNYINIIKSYAPELKGKWGVMKLPAFEAGGCSDAVTEGTSLMITKASKNKRVAIEFAKYVVSDENSLLDGFNNYDIFPAYSSFFSNKVLGKKDEYFDSTNMWKMFRNSAKNSYNNYYNDNYLDIQKDIISTQSSILLKNEDTQIDLDKLQMNVINNYYKKFLQ